MKGAYLLAKDTAFFCAFMTDIKTLGYDYDDSPNSVRLNVTESVYFTFYDRIESASYFEDHEIPAEASQKGYKYGYLVECRDEELFCKIVRSIGKQIDFVVCDGDGVVFQPDQIDPGLLML